MPFKLKVVCMRVLDIFILFSIVLLSCKSNEEISPSNSSSNPFSSASSIIPGVYVAGYDGVKQNGWGIGKVWKNEEVLFSSSSTSIIEDVFITGKDVYAVGFEFDGKITNATIWKNGVATILGNKIKGSYAHSLFVSGNDVYVCGRQDDSKGSPSAIIWKNGTPSILDLNGELYTIFVSGSDIYASGETGVYPTGGLSIFKNGRAIYFEKQGGYPTGMFVMGNDVYVSGYGNDNTGSQAKLWKNGVATILDKVATGSVSANDVFVSGNDVYVVGEKQLNTYNSFFSFYPSVAVLWKNGFATNLTNGNTRASANSVFVSGSDVFVCGYEFIHMSNTSGGGTNNGKIWKNGLAGAISKTNNNLIPTSIFVVK